MAKEGYHTAGRPRVRFCLPTRTVVLLPALLGILLSGCLGVGSAHRSQAAAPAVEGAYAPSTVSGVPEGISARLTGRNLVTISWKDEFRDASGYIIERSTGQDFMEIARVESGTNRFHDTRLSPAATYSYRIRAYNSTGASGYSQPVRVKTSSISGPVIIDHDCTDLQAIPVRWIKEAKRKLRIAYGRTDHGSQITCGMEGLASFRGSLYAVKQGARGGEALDLRGGPFSRARDLTSPDSTAWAAATRKYLKKNPEVNVVVWSWGTTSGITDRQVEGYLNLMESLEREHPRVMFVYMTAPLDGTGLEGSLHRMNDQIRDFCRSKGKILYDFEDIESYDPDGTYFGDKYAHNSCDYDGDMDGRRDANWAVQWQGAHMEGEDWFECESPLTKPLNANLKAYAAWWLWARLAGWNGG